MFLLKKIAAPFLFPVPLSLLFALSGLFFLFFTRRRRTGKLLVAVGVLIFALLGFDQISSKIIVPLEQKYGAYSPSISGNVSDPVKFVAVLGGGHTSDPSLPVTSQLSRASLLRLVEGIRVYRKNPGSKIILSGGAEFDAVPEAKTLADAAQALGMKGAMALFRKLGMDPIPAPAGHLAKKSKGLSPGQFFPSAGSLQKAERAVYEYLGIMWARLRGQI